KRGITELVTPGVSYHEKTLDSASNQFLASVVISDGQYGVAFLDISTGEFLTAQGPPEYIDRLLQNFRPSEVLYQRQYERVFKERYTDRFFSYRLDDWIYTPDFAHGILTKHFETKSLKGFGIDELNLGILACGAAMHYLADTQHDRIGHIRHIQRIEEDSHMWLDRFTIRNLELVYSPHEGAQTLLDILDDTRTPMGARLLRRWLLLPLKDLVAIEQRHAVVAFLSSQHETLDKLAHELQPIGDLERMISRVAVGRIAPREVLQLHRALEHVAAIKELSDTSGNGILSLLSNQLNSCLPIQDRIVKTLHPDAPMALNKGQVIADGVDAELDELRGLANNGKDYLQQIQERESERTGIPSLKISFNNVFGYFLDVRNTHKDKVPSDWIRKQTLTQSERYITEELKIYEQKILGAEEKIASIEFRLYHELVQEVAQYIAAIQLNSQVIAQLDCLQSLAAVANKHGYVRPAMNDSKVIQILHGRHPVIERRLPPGEEYVANDVYLDNDTQQVMMITGPNMSGKSALLRQTALIVLMAQMGSFVPASAADLGIVDKIFTRVGASDNISSGESTFMVEMNETASILNNLSDRSLVLLDEIGRGTSTYDGVSIAWSIAEFIHEHPRVRAKTLFATHYHELNEMTHQFERIRNYNVSIKESGSQIIFLRKLQQGGSNHSFGIHVAKLAGMPFSVVERAKQILVQLEQSHGEGISQSERGRAAAQSKAAQLSFFQLDDPALAQIRDEISNMDLNTITPIEALMKLNEIRKIIRGK
ncbi:MAG: DNA mismatch repair protein MutS, partial [Flavobacteriales bacterium]